MSADECEILRLIHSESSPTLTTISSLNSCSREFKFNEALGFSVSPSSSKDFFKDKFMLAYSDSNENFKLQWEITSSKGYVRWEEFRHDHETSQGKCVPHDMLYAFQLLPWSPEFKSGIEISKHFLHLWKKHYPNYLNPQPTIPPLASLKKLLGSEILVNGMWILVVRMPRPHHGKPHVPLSMRKDNCRFPGEGEAEWLARKNEIKRKCEGELHPTEGQLYITLNNTLIQEVPPNIVCSKCGAKGHHHEKSHDDVYSSEVQVFDEMYAWQTFLREPEILTPQGTTTSTATDVEPEAGNLMKPPTLAQWIKFHSSSRVKKIELKPKFPAWMNVLPYPKECLVLTKLLSEEKGLTLQIRQAETKIPLRLARKLMMDGLHIEGEVYASGVGKRKRVRKEEDDEAEKIKATARDLDTEATNKDFEYKPLQLNIQDEEIMDLEFKSRVIKFYSEHL